MIDRQDYFGVETGPVRPPSEAGSLYIRVSRNCPWNRCRFCPLYKGLRFSRRPVEHVLRDIDLLADEAESLRSAWGGALGHIASARQNGMRDTRVPSSARMVGRWMEVGGRTVFLQDANALGAPHNDLLEILSHIRRRMPWVERVTSYARSRSVLALDSAQLAELKAAGLGRIHVGFESGSDEVLTFMQKGATKAVHLEAGLRLKQAGIELSAYYMPGLGGSRLLTENALETADLMRRVQPDYVRLRSLAVSDQAPLATDITAGSFSKAGDIEMVREILLFLQQVGDIPSELVSDHAVNLLSGLSGDLATKRKALMSSAEEFLSLEPKLQRLFMTGRRLGAFVRLEDIQVPARREYAERQCRRLGVTDENVETIVTELVRRFV